MTMIEITDGAAEVLMGNMVKGSVVRMILAATDATGANYVLAWGDPVDDDVVFESNGIRVHMTPEDAEILGDSPTIIDYVDTEDLGRGFIIQGPEDEGCGCGHDHEHGHEDESCGC
ncbi:MAG: adhesin [Methanothrix sp.]|jgi:iron-sulfur cluster assembly protein|nr:adhesin [Methanothrix sp.]OPY51780.1 MAG: iron-sulfur cluster assembly protein [Methanosaeta sp. PtaU1.Bin055]HQA63463.1 adhesin [Methanothrix sp.]